MTEVYFSFDTEDYTDPASWDASVREADLLKKYGVRGNFNVVGYLAREWLRRGRTDVPQALKDHDVSFHSLGHSYHPTISEYTDLADYEEARRRFLARECEGIGMVKAATGADEIVAACPPGNNLSYVAMYGYAALGIPLYVGSVFRTERGNGVWLCNSLHLNYDYSMEKLFIRGSSDDVDRYELSSFLDRIAGKKRVVIYTHPNRAIHSAYWDEINYKKGNLHKWGEWEPTPRYPGNETEVFFEKLEALLAAMQKDERFRFCEMRELRKRAKEKFAARIVEKGQLDDVRRQLNARFGAVRLPSGTFSPADCFAAAAHFCHSEEPFRPGPVYGFLETPQGVTGPVTLTAAEVRTLAKTYDPNAFLQTVYTINGKKIGPADLLFAMLDVAEGKETVVLSPRPQLPELDGDLAPLAKLRLKNTWVYRDDFEDRYLSDRLRLQSWTIREED